MTTTATEKRVETAWKDVDRYIESTLVHSDDALDAALARSAAAGLPPIAVSPAQGKFLYLVARAMGAHRILEIGTLGGYSTIWLARALPEGGRLVTIEVNPGHARVARESLQRAGVDKHVSMRVGAAADVLKQLIADHEGHFDFVFIDADKEHMADYFRQAMLLSHTGTVIVADNVVRDGAVVSPDDHSDLVAGVRRFMSVVAADPRVSATAIQTVGVKGYDGFAMMVVN
jgi:predicted O-methyltransferase YrrM